MKYQLIAAYKLKNNESYLFSSEWLDGESALDMGEEFSHHPKWTEIKCLDENGTSWTIKELNKLLEEVEEEPHDLVIYFDGGFHDETKTSGSGAVIYYRQGKKKYRIRANECFHELESNNEAEYAALFFALSQLEELNVSRQTCEIRGDAKGLLMQLAGEWPCYEKVLNDWLDRIEEKVSLLSLNVTYTPIVRKENQEAHKLATQSLNGKKIYSKMQLL
ncbi:reverse transcriptase-like protein [Cytobacillus kochii]|uniref:reverse transcriptase-like protein n=1 Tax=Cytobacillus kochii TaxID=859143 RepID=UPI00384C0BDD